MWEGPAQQALGFFKPAVILVVKYVPIPVQQQFPVLVPVLICVTGIVPADDPFGVFRVISRAFNPAAIAVSTSGETDSRVMPRRIPSNGRSLKSSIAVFGIMLIYTLGWSL